MFTIKAEFKQFPYLVINSAKKTHYKAQKFMEVLSFSDNLIFQSVRHNSAKSLILAHRDNKQITIYYFCPPHLMCLFGCEWRVRILQKTLNHFHFIILLLNQALKAAGLLLLNKFVREVSRCKQLACLLALAPFFIVVDFFFAFVFVICFLC